MPADRRRRFESVGSDPEVDHPRQRRRRVGNSEPSNNQDDDDINDNGEDIGIGRRLRERHENRQENLTGEKEEDWEIQCLWIARLGFLLSRYVKPHQICKEVKEKWKGPAPSREQEEVMCNQLQKMILSWRREVLSETQKIIRRWLSTDHGREWIQQVGNEFELPQGAADTNLDEFLSGCGPIIWRSTVDFFDDDVVEVWNHSFFKALDDVVAMIAVPILKHEWTRRELSQSHFQCIPQLDATLRLADKSTKRIPIGMLPTENSYRPGLELGEGRRTFNHALPKDPHSMPVAGGIGGRYWNVGGNDGSGDTGAGNTGAGNAGAGNTGAGNTGAGNTSAGNTSTRNTGGGNTSAGNTGAGDISYGSPILRTAPQNRRRQGGAPTAGNTSGNDGGGDGGVGNSRSLGPVTPPDSSRRRRSNVV